MVLEQQILDRADIERRRRGCGNVVFDRDRAIGRGRERKVRSDRKRRDDKGVVRGSQRRQGERRIGDATG